MAARKSKEDIVERISLESLKDFILWCKHQKVAKVSLGEVSFELHDAGILDIVVQDMKEENIPDPMKDSTTVDMWQDEDMFHSS